MRSLLLLLFISVLNGCPYLRRLKDQDASLNKDSLVSRSLLSDSINLDTSETTFHLSEVVKGNNNPPPSNGGNPPPAGGNNPPPSNGGNNPPPAAPSLRPSSTVNNSKKPTLVPTKSFNPTFSTFSPSVKPTISPSSAVLQPAFCLKTNGTSVKPTQSGVCSAYLGIKQAFLNVLPADVFNQSNLFGQVVRLAFHDAGEVNLLSPTDLLGPDGCLSTVTADSAGLIEPDSLVRTVLEPIWQTYCDQISRADFWVLFAKLVIEQSAVASGGSISINYQFGRVDASPAVGCQAGAGRLPNAALGADENTRVFVNQMGLSLSDATTLIGGGHSLGHVHIASSGYGEGGNLATLQANPTRNSWDVTPSVLDNQYFQSLLIPWHNTISPSVTTLNQWLGPGQIMLNTDMSLAYSINTPSGVGIGTQACKSTNPYGCVSPTNTTVPSTLSLVQSYANNNQAFLTAFATSFVKMTTVGYGIPNNAVPGSTASGKLGTLTSIQLTSC